MHKPTHGGRKRTGLGRMSKICLFSEAIKAGAARTEVAQGFCQS